MKQPSTPQLRSDQPQNWRTALATPPVYRPAPATGAAPAVYRPNAPAPLQRKMGTAPPIYRPAPAIGAAPAVYRPKAAALLQRKMGTAPPIYRPEPAAGAAPAVYRPKAATLVQPKVKSSGGVGSSLSPTPGHLNPVTATGQPVLGRELAHAAPQGHSRFPWPFGGTANVLQRVIEARCIVRVSDSGSPSFGKLGLVTEISGGECRVAWDEDKGARLQISQLEEMDVVLGYHSTVNEIDAWDESRARTGHAMGSGDPSSRENELGDGVYVVPFQYVGDYDDMEQESNLYIVKGIKGVDYGIVKDTNGHQSVLTKKLGLLRFFLHSKRPSIRSRVTVASSSSLAPPLFTGVGAAPKNEEGKNHYSAF